MERPALERRAVSAATQMATENAPSTKRAIVSDVNVVRKGKDVTHAVYPSSPPSRTGFGDTRSTSRPIGSDRQTIPSANAVASPPIASLGTPCASRCTARTAMDVP